MNRRTALALLGTVAGYLYGRPAAGSQGQVMFLALDSVDVITVQYRGRRVSINPNEILDALGGTPPFPTQMQQFPRSKQ